MLALRIMEPNHPLAMPETEARMRTEEHRTYIHESKRGRIREWRRIAADLDRGIYRAAGYTNLETWLVYIGIEMSVSHFLRQLTALRKLTAVPDMDLERMPEANMQRLAQLPEHLVKVETIESAIGQKPEEFARTVAEIRLKKLGEVPEDYRTFKITLPKLVYEAVRDAEAHVAASLGLDLEDSGKHAQIDVWERIAAFVRQTPAEQLRNDL